MATLTIRNLPDDVVSRIKATAQRRGHSMEQEVRLLLSARFASRDEVLDRVRRRWDGLSAPSADEVDRWRTTGRR